jgi:hypothetical protein
MAGHGFGGNSAYVAAKALGQHKIRACALLDGMMLTLTGNQFQSDFPILGVYSKNYININNEKCDLDLLECRDKIFT